jgi:hypothetical protein
VAASARQQHSDFLGPRFLQKLRGGAPDGLQLLLLRLEMIGYFPQFRVPPVGKHFLAGLDQRKAIGWFRSRLTFLIASSITASAANWGPNSRTISS